MMLVQVALLVATVTDAQAVLLVAALELARRARRGAA
jgi:hypothetical protein